MSDLLLDNPSVVLVIGWIGSRLQIYSAVVRIARRNGGRVSFRRYLEVRWPQITGSVISTVLAYLALLAVAPTWMPWASPVVLALVAAVGADQIVARLTSRVMRALRDPNDPPGEAGTDVTTFDEIAAEVSMPREDTTARREEA